MKINKESFVFTVFILSQFFFFSTWASEDYQEYITTGDVNTSGELSFYKSSGEAEDYGLVKSKEVRNVILLIGDGMGLNQIAAARIKGAGLNGKLYLEKLPVTGIMRTHSLNNIVTDSAASGTAIACGVKTNNKMLGMTPDGGKYMSILEAAKKENMFGGLVATSRITHATPAVFASHIDHRDKEVEIAPQMLENKVDVLLGGGRQYFLPRSRDNRRARRRDGRNLIEEATKAGYQYVENKEQLMEAKGPFLLGLFQMDSLTTREPEPSLAELTDKSIEVLDLKTRRANRGDFLGDFLNFITLNMFEDKAGFFLMVEGSQIDWACHDYEVERMIRLTLLFDMAVKEAMDFAVKDGHTLVIVTADHETSGLTITEAADGNDLELLWAVDKEHKRTTSGHSGQPVAVFAYGPGAENFSGVYDNTDIAKKIAEVLDIGNFPRKIEEN